MSDTRSNDTRWNPSTYAIITGAMRLLSAIQSGETPPDDEYQDALTALNGVIHAWQANNLHVWTQVAFVVPLVTNKAAYTIGIGAPDIGNFPRPLKISGGRLTITGTGQEFPLIEMTRLDYANMSNKLMPPGPPTHFYYNAQLPYGIISLFPPPDAATAMNGVVTLIGQRPMQTFDTQSDTADVPQEWISALRFALATDLAPEYDCPADRFKIIKGLADEKLEVVKSWDVEPQGTSTLPFSQSVYQLIAGALRLCGGCGPTELPTLSVINNGFFALNAMVKAWQATGIHVWTETDAMLFLQPVQEEYEIGDTSPDHCTYSNEVVQMQLTATANPGDRVISVNDVSQIAPEFKLGIWLDSGYMFWAHVNSTAATQINMDAAMPSQATSGGIVVCYQNDLVRPLKMPAARRYIFAALGGTPIEIPLGILSRIDYAQIPTKKIPGSVPVDIFFEPTLVLSRVHIWPPMAVGQQNAVKMTVQLPLATYADLTTVNNFPDEWQDAIRFNLALNLWPEHAERRAAVKGDYNLQLITAQATDKLMTAQNWDREPESVYFGLQSFPDTRN